MKGAKRTSNILINTHIGWNKLLENKILFFDENNRSHLLNHSCFLESRLRNDLEVFSITHNLGITIIICHFLKFNILHYIN